VTNVVVVGLAVGVVVIPFVRGGGVAAPATTTTSSSSIPFINIVVVFSMSK
jgi:hypothetical protein